MKTIITILFLALMITSCQELQEITVTGEVAVVYTNGEQDIVKINEKLTARNADTSDVSVYLMSNDGASCLVIGCSYGYNNIACGVRKIQVLNLKKTIKNL